MAQVLIPLGLLWTVTYFFQLNDRLDSWSVIKKSLAFFPCSSSSPRPCQQLYIHCLLACVQWMEWPHSLHDLNYSLFILFLLMLFLQRTLPTSEFPSNFLVCAVEWMKVKHAYDALCSVIQDHPTCSVYWLCDLSSNTLFPLCPTHKVEAARPAFWLPWPCLCGLDSLACQVCLFIRF